MNDLGLAPLLLRIFGDVDALELLLPSWTALWQRAPNATPFQSPAWLIAWWRCFGWGELFVASVWEGDRLVAIAPCFLAERKLRLVGLAISDYLDILVDPLRPDAARLILDALLDRRRDWDECLFTDLAPDATLLRLAAPEGVCDRLQDSDPCPVLSFPAGDFRASLPRRMRRNLAVSWRYAQRVAPLEIATDRSVFDTLVELHGARWRGRGESGVLADRAVVEFHRQALPGLDRLGILRLYAIVMGGKPVAAYYGFLHRGRAYAYLTGFDPTIEGQSLGTLAVGQGLAEGARDGASEFHFLRGGEAYKYLWGGVDRLNRIRSWQAP